MNLKFSVKKNNLICLSPFLIERAINKMCRALLAIQAGRLKMHK